MSSDTKREMTPDEMRDYIGDGVYVEFDGYVITLSTTRAYEKHFIVLEPEHLAALNRFNARMRELPTPESI